MAQYPGEILDSSDDSLFELRSTAPAREGRLPLTEEMLTEGASGNIFAMSLNVAMGWQPTQLLGREVLLLSTHGGVRAEDGTPIALGYHTGHWEVNLLVKAAAEELKRRNAIPFAGFVTDPCDGRTQGTVGMYDSLPYRNDASMVFRRLIRSLPTRHGVVGVATCDKGLPAMMMALAGEGKYSSVLVPGGVSLLPDEGEDAGKVQSVGARYAHGEMTMEEAQEAGCRACASPGGGCQFLGTAATSQVVAEALGMTLTHAALAPSGHPIWLDAATRSAKAVLHLIERGIRMNDILTEGAFRNALAVYAAFGGSTNLVIHLPAVAYHAGVRRPTVEDWARINRSVPRIVDALPNGPMFHPTVRVFQAGGVPEVMLHLKRAGLLDLDVMTASGQTLGQALDWWEHSERRRILRERLQAREGFHPDDVIMSPEQAAAKGLTSTVCFPTGNLAPGGSVIKSTAIDASVVDADGVYRKRGPAKVFTVEKEAIQAVKGRGPKALQPGDILVLCCRGPMGSGMEEIYQITSALKHLSFGKQIAVLTDARFSGVSTGACIGHITPEALAGGPLGKVRDGDMIEIIVDRNRLEGSVNLIGENGQAVSVGEGDRLLATRGPNPALKHDDFLPDDTRLWAALQAASGGTWNGSVYDVDRILEVLNAGLRALERH
jgi:putative YjhG/YagF family dehydratase